MFTAMHSGEKAGRVLERKWKGRFCAKRAMPSHAYIIFKTRPLYARPYSCRRAIYHDAI